MKILKLSILALVCVAFTSTGIAQTLKMGHINSQALLAVMPEVKDAQAQLESYINQLDGQAKTMTGEYQKLLEDYQIYAQSPSADDLIRKSKEDKIMDLERRIQEFQVSAQEKIGKKEAELYAPIETKSLDAINTVAEQNGFTYVLNSASLVYAATTSQDILPLVKTHLGIAN